MVKRNVKQVVEDRWEKKEEVGRIIQDKFKVLRQVPPLQAKTEAQKHYLKSLKENTISVASGHAGCGKSFCAAYYAAQLLNENQIEKILVTRPYAHLGTDYGATPGSDYDKLLPFCRPTLDTIKKVLGEGNFNYCVEKGVVEIAPLEKIQGRSFDEEQILDALKGVDLLFDADELFERLQRFDEYRKMQETEGCDCEVCQPIEEEEEFKEEVLDQETIDKLLSVVTEEKPKRKRGK